MSISTFDKDKTYIVYDGECPFCSRYVSFLRFREAVGPVLLVNARDDHPVVRHVEERGVVLDREMALVHGGYIYSGHDCINRMALMSTASGAFNRMNAFIFASARISSLVYPPMRMFRNLTLRLLGKRPIREQQ